jgi:hypothetical protein
LPFRVPIALRGEQKESRSIALFGPAPRDVRRRRVEMRFYTRGPVQSELGVEWIGS